CSPGPGRSRRARAAASVPLEPWPVPAYRRRALRPSGEAPDLAVAVEIARTASADGRVRRVAADFVAVVPAALAFRPGAGADLDERLGALGRKFQRGSRGDG